MLEISIDIVVYIKPKCKPHMDRNYMTYESIAACTRRKNE